MKLRPAISKTRNGVLGALLALFTLAIFWTDLSLPSGFNASYLYILVVLAVGLWGKRRLVIATTVTVLALSLFAFIDHADELGEIPRDLFVFSRVSSMVIIVLTAVMVLAWLSRARTIQNLVTELQDAVGERESTRHVVAAAQHVTSIGTWSFDYNPEGRLVWSAELGEIFAMPAGYQPTSDEVLAYYDEADRIRVRDSIRAANEVGDSFMEEAGITAGDGTRKTVLVMGQARVGPHGQPIALAGVIQDVTLWRDAESAVATQRRRFTQLATSLPFIIWTADGVGTVDYFNEAAERYSGLTGPELLDDGWTQTIHPDDAASLGSKWEYALESRTPFEAELRLRASDGTYRWHQTSAQPEISADGEVLRWWGCTLDIETVYQLRTDATRLSDQLDQAQRLESVGRLTGGIAHDFNNLLTVVTGGAEAIADDPALNEDSREMASLILQAAARGAELTHRLLAFARRQPLEPVPTDIEAQIAAVAPLLKRTIGESIAIEVVKPDELPLVAVDPGQLENALLNLAINGRDAMPAGGTLTIEAHAVSVETARETPHGEIAPGPYVVVTVTDTGTGIDPQIIPQLFDPFFTTKGAGRGSGLGLPMVWGFVTQSGGHVSVRSDMGQGTSFDLYLPLADSWASAAATPTVDDFAPMRGSGHIVVVEDDALVQKFAADQLRSNGYEVTVASSGREALDLLESLDHIDLLFTDVIMPGGMTGRDLAEKMLERRPGTPVLYASGYTEDVILHNGRLEAGVALLAKPYSGRRLLQRVHETLRRGEEANA